MSSIFEQPDVQVMTYNLKNGTDLPHWERRKTALADVIRQQAPTILGTQEGMEFQLAYLRDELEHYDVLGEGRVPFLGDEYCAVFVDRRVAIVEDSGTFWLSSTPRVPGSKMGDEVLPRIATWVRMRVNETPVLFVNTHLTYLEDGIAAQMTVLADELQGLIEPQIETILTGDFNIGRHREHIHPLRALGFEDVWSFTEKHAGPVFTFPDWTVWGDRTENVHDENRIDWVLVRPPDGSPLPDVDVEVVHTHHAEPLPSDHFPVVVKAAR